MVLNSQEVKDNFNNILRKVYDLKLGVKLSPQDIQYNKHPLGEQEIHVKGYRVLHLGEIEKTCIAFRLLLNEIIPLTVPADVWIGEQFSHVPPLRTITYTKQIWDLMELCYQIGIEFLPHQLGNCCTMMELLLKEILEGRSAQPYENMVRCKMIMERAIWLNEYVKREDSIQEQLKLNLKIVYHPSIYNLRKYLGLPLKSLHVLMHQRENKGHYYEITQLFPECTSTLVYVE